MSQFGAFQRNGTGLWLYSGALLSPCLRLGFSRNILWQIIKNSRKEKNPLFDTESGHDSVNEERVSTMVV